MPRPTPRRASLVAGFAALVLMSAATPALAHGGSVDPPAEPQDCRNLALSDKGAADHAEGGTATAGSQGSTVAWGHCD